MKFSSEQVTESGFKTLFFRWYISSKIIKPLNNSYVELDWTLMSLASECKRLMVLIETLRTYK